MTIQNKNNITIDSLFITFSLFMAFCAIQIIWVVWTSFLNDSSVSITTVEHLFLEPSKKDEFSVFYLWTFLNLFFLLLSFLGSSLVENFLKNQAKENGGTIKYKSMDEEALSLAIISTVFLTFVTPFLHLIAANFITTDLYEYDDYIYKETNAPIAVLMEKRDSEGEEISEDELEKYLRCIHNTLSLDIAPEKDQYTQDAVIYSCKKYEKRAGRNFSIEEEKMEQILIKIAEEGVDEIEQTFKEISTGKEINFKLVKNEGAL